LDDGAYGCKGADRLFGGRGDDYLEGEKGSDVVHGGPGSDLMIDGRRRGDDDSYLGGAGSDLVSFVDERLSLQISRPAKPRATETTRSLRSRTSVAATL
jgi:hemolysin type calcium-binding protein